jgi:hypothetical protein
MIRVFAARSGAATLTIDGVAIHSAYDPEREAQRFIRDSLGDDVPSTVIVLGEGLGHLTTAVRARYPAVRTIRIVYSQEIFRAAPEGTDLAWHPGADRGLTGFLRSHLDEIDVEGLRVIEWPASARLFPAVSLMANRAVRQVAQEMNGSLVTTLASGRLWIRNTFANFLSLANPVAGAPCGRARPVLIAAPGPTLEHAVSLIREARASFELWALPTSCNLLESAGLSPDLIVMTDGGFYSMHHLQFSALSCPIAMPLSAARGSWNLNRKPGLTGPFLLEQPAFFESALLRAAGVTVPIVPPHGTVAATAIDLALSVTDAPVIVAGLDMCSLDILSHARPNAFDALLHLQAGRLTPHTSLCFQRASRQLMRRLEAGGRSRVSPSLLTYAGWLNEEHASGRNRLYRLLPSSVPLAGMRALDRTGFLALLSATRGGARGNQIHELAGYPQPSRRREIAAEMLQRWTAQIAAAGAVLSSGKTTPLEKFPEALALAGTIEPRFLIEARKKARAGDTAGARAAADAVMEGCAAFLRLLEEKTHAA